MGMVSFSPEISQGPSLRHRLLLLLFLGALIVQATSWTSPDLIVVLALHFATCKFRWKPYLLGLITTTQHCKQGTNELGHPNLSHDLNYCWNLVGHFQYGRAVKLSAAGYLDLRLT